jgi:hypothetical protein
MPEMRPSLGDEGMEEVENELLPAHERLQPFEEQTANGVVAVVWIDSAGDRLPENETETCS